MRGQPFGPGTIEKRNEDMKARQKRSAPNSKLSDAQLDYARRLRRLKFTLAEIGAMLHVTASGLSRMLERGK